MSNKLADKKMNIRKKKKKTIILGNHTNTSLWVNQRVTCETTMMLMTETSFHDKLTMVLLYNGKAE